MSCHLTSESWYEDYPQQELMPVPIAFPDDPHHAKVMDPATPLMLGTPSPQGWQSPSQMNDQPPTSPDSPSSSPDGRKARRPPKSKRNKLYEQTEKLDDPILEKRRLDAINSKKNRDRRKESLTQLRQQVEEFTAQRNKLQQDVEYMRQREAQLQQQLRAGPALTHLNFTQPLQTPTTTTTTSSPSTSSCLPPSFLHSYNSPSSPFHTFAQCPSA